MRSHCLLQMVLEPFIAGWKRSARWSLVQGRGIWRDRLPFHQAMPNPKELGQIDRTERFQPTIRPGARKREGRGGIVLEIQSPDPTCRQFEYRVERTFFQITTLNCLCRIDRRFLDERITDPDP